MLQINKNKLYDKIHACWIGKNIGGTVGAPYEGIRSTVNLTDIDSTFKLIPNDDLDLQLVWLKAMEEYGPYNINSNVLAEYWLDFIPPHWNEYGVCKSNFKVGMMPPLSGEIDNDKWKTSNGGWIRTEIWACLAPGFPAIAAKYAYMDSIADHGVSEGAYSSVFVAVMESVAFFNSDINECIEIALKAIPEESLTAKSVLKAIDCYKSGKDWLTARNEVFKVSEELGWFQAPANIGYVIIGLLYGEGDLKKSILCAVNCGDDTDCTGATVGAFLGILHGTQGIPENLMNALGDEIKNVAVSGDCYDLPGTCDELTKRIMWLLPVVFKANGANIEYTDGEDKLEHSREIAVKEGISWAMSDRGLYDINDLWKNNSYTYDAFDTGWATARVELSGAPHISANNKFSLRVILKNKTLEQMRVKFRVIVPEGWSAEYKKMVYLDEELSGLRGEFNLDITPSDNVEAVNRIIIEAVAEGRCNVGLASVTLFG